MSPGLPNQLCSLAVGVLHLAEAQNNGSLAPRQTRQHAFTGDRNRGEVEVALTFSLLSEGK